MRDYKRSLTERGHTTPYHRGTSHKIYIFERISRVDSINILEKLRLLREGIGNNTGAFAANIFMRNGMA